VTVRHVMFLQRGHRLFSSVTVCQVRFCQGGTSSGFIREGASLQGSSWTVYHVKFHQGETSSKFIREGCHTGFMREVRRQGSSGRETVMSNQGEQTPPGLIRKRDINTVFDSKVPVLRILRPHFLLH
jgi:hypothetical protein